MGIISGIKAQIEKSGQNLSNFLYFKNGSKIRVRFLQELDDGMEVVFHDNFTQGVNTPCLETFGQHCPFCGRDDLRTRSKYIWSVWDYEANEVKLLMEPANKCSPVSQLVSFYDNYGTILDRDYVIEQKGSQKDKTFSVVPMDKVVFTNKKAKAFSQSKVREILQQAFCSNQSLDVSSNANNKQANSLDDDEIPWSTPESSQIDKELEGKTPLELYKMCVEQNLDVDKRMTTKYYITKLKEAKKAEDDWSDDNEWEDEA